MISNLLCKYATNKTCKVFKKLCSANKDTPITELMDIKQLEQYKHAENKVIAILSLNIIYQQIKDFLNGGSIQVKEKE